MSKPVGSVVQTLASSSLPSSCIRKGLGEGETEPVTSDQNVEKRPEPQRTDRSSSTKAPSWVRIKSGATSLKVRKMLLLFRKICGRESLTNKHVESTTRVSEAGVLPAVRVSRV
jgi:hypothetical protein